MLSCEGGGEGKLCDGGLSLSVRLILYVWILKMFHYSLLCAFWWHPTLAELPVCQCGHGHSYIADYEGTSELCETMVALNQ